MNDYFADLIAVGPEMILCGTILILLMADLWRMGRDRVSVWFVALGVTFFSCYGLIQVGHLYNQSQASEGGIVLLPEFLGIALAYGTVTLGDLFFRGRDRWVPGVIVLIGTLIAGYRLWQLGDTYFHGLTQQEDFWGQLVHVDGFSILFRAFSILCLLICTWFTIFYRPMEKGQPARGVPEFLSCLVCAHVGAMFLVSTTHLLFIFLSLEILSLCSYMQSGMLKGDRRSAEASLKYVLYGSMASGFMLFGFSLLFAFSGQLTLAGIGNFVSQSGDLMEKPEGILIWLGIVASIGGFAYKITAVPFHFWAPDTYEGSPTPTTAFLAVGSKAASFGILIRFVGSIAGDMVWGPKVLSLVAILAALTMTYGNLAALRQSNLKRMFAYSSIAHAGYMLVGVVALFTIAKTGDTVTSSTYNIEGSVAIIYYLLAYLIMTLGAFGVVIYMANRTGSEEIDDLRGLGWKTPFVAGSMVIFLLSLTGLPPTAGFFGKWLIFVAAIHADYAWLAVVAIINSVISLFYYFRIAKALFLRPEEEAKCEVPRSTLFALSLVLLALLAVWFGLFPDGGTALAREAARGLR